MFEQKQSGLTIALSGAAGSAVNSAVSAAQSANDESDDRLAALKGTQAAMSGAQAGQALQLDEVKGSDPQNNNTVGISASLGTQSSKSRSHSEQNTATGSTLTAGDNISITATGSDITAIGSQIKAGQDVTLDAAKDINLISSQNTQLLEGENKSSGGAIGIGIGVGSGGAGITISASGNSSKGSESGNGTQQNETTIDAGSQVTLRSGDDTTIAGAQVSGNKVVADIGGDLTISSLQDSDRYDSKQQSVSGGVSYTWGAGSASASISISKDKIHSNYDSVIEQSGIFAGDGGFDITVGNHTQLDGAVIASTATADKNSLDTGTLGFSDIGNKAEYDTSHVGGGFSTGGSIEDNFIGNMANVLLVGAGGDGNAEGTTKSAISAGNITIRDKENQQQDVADLSRDVENANGSISPIFDKEKEQKRLEMAQTLGEIGSQVADIARTAGEINAIKAGKAELERKGEKEPAKGAPQKEWDEYNTSLAATDSYKEAQKQYGTGSAIQQGISAATAALQGLAGGDLKAAIAGGAAPYLAEQVKKQIGEDNVAANAIAHAIVGGVIAELQGRDAGAGAAGAAAGELIAQVFYPGVKREDLTEAEKQKIVALSTLAAGLAGGLAGDDTEGIITGAQSGKNAVENNALGCSPTTCPNSLGDDLMHGGGMGGGTAGGVAGAGIGAIIASIFGDDESTVSDTGGDQIVDQGPSNTGGNQQFDQNGIPTNTGNTESGNASSNNTGNTDGGIDTGGNTTTTPIAEQNPDDLAYTSDNSKYVPSPKHAAGGWGTPMDLSDSKAQEVLNNSIQGGKQKYGISDGKIYEFQPDNVGGWYGYPVPGTEAPPKVLREFLARGDISKAEYNKMIKGK